MENDGYENHHEENDAILDIDIDAEDDLNDQEEQGRDEGRQLNPEPVEGDQQEHILPLNFPVFERGRGSYPRGRGSYPRGRGGYPRGRGGYPRGRGGYPRGRGGYPRGRGHARGRGRGRGYAYQRGHVRGNVMIGRCYNCGQRGHRAEDCHARSLCWICGQRGHIKMVCPRRLQQEERAVSSVLNFTQCTFEKFNV